MVHENPYQSPEAEGAHVEHPPIAHWKILLVVTACFFLAPLLLMLALAWYWG